jgi:M6 family metalloprotease-like protein
MSMPFAGKTFTFTNPDGSTFEVRGWGDQSYAVFETLDGYTVVKDPATGYYQYAVLSEDKNSLVPSGTNVGAGNPRDLGLRPQVRVRPEAARQLARSAQAPLQGERRWETRRKEKKTLKTSAARGGPLAAPPAGTTVGNYVGLCLLIQFPDVPGTIPASDVDKFCNQQGYTGFGNNGSVRDYFYDVSDHKLIYTNVVTAYYQAAHNRAHYTDPTVPYGTRARQLIAEALDHLVAQGFNFGQLSGDSGGFVYACNVFYAGPVVNNWSEGLWPHSWSLAAPYVTASGKKIFDYQITNIGAQLTLGTFCHENGHMICDFPDLYDYGYQSNGAGNYCLMAFGGTDDRNPVQVDAYLKNEAGWTTSLTPITPGITGTVSAGQNDFYIFSKSATEYFIVENRQQQGRDQSLPDGGLAIWHIDELGSNSNEQMTPALHFECSLEQADNLFHLEHGTNYGDANDLYSAPYNARFANDTVPNSRWWDGSASGLTIAAISASGPVMTFSTSAGASELHRYWNDTAGDHFYTTSWAELGSGNYGWVYEGVQCYVHAAPEAGTVPLHRYWNGDIADHFYTTDFGELGSGNYGWLYEGVQCYVYPSPTTDTVALHRYWNSDIGDHFYTTEWGELGSGNYGWVYEGVQCYVLKQPAPGPGPGQTVPATFTSRRASSMASGTPATFRTAAAPGARASGGPSPIPDTFRVSAAAGSTSVPPTFRYRGTGEGQASRPAGDRRPSVTVRIDQPE